MLQHNDPLAAALPSRQMASRFNPFAATSHGGAMTPSAKTDLHRMAVKAVEFADPQLPDRQRVEIALPARLMWSWTQKCNKPWAATTWDTGLMDRLARNFTVEMSTCMIGLPDGKNGRADERVRVYNRMIKVAESLLFPIQACPVNVRPSNLTGFMSCSFVWQQLIEDGKLELEDSSLFHRTWNAFADEVVAHNTLDDLERARKSALKRKDVMMSTLKEQGYYPK